MLDGPAEARPVGGLGLHLVALFGRQRVLCA